MNDKEKKEEKKDINEMTFSEKRNDLEEDFLKKREDKNEFDKKFYGKREFDVASDVGELIVQILFYMSYMAQRRMEFQDRWKELQKKLEKLNQQEKDLIEKAKELYQNGKAEIKKEDKIILLTLDKEKQNVNAKTMNLEKTTVISEMNYPFEEKWLDKEKDNKNLSEKENEKIEPWNKSDLEKNPWDKTEDNPWDKSNSIDDEDMDNPWAEKLQSDKENENSLDNELELD